MLIDGQFTVAAPPQALMAHLFDARLMAECLPGCESLEALDADRYRAVVGLAMAGVKARFELEVQVTRREPMAVWSTTRGEEGGNASQVQAENRITLEAVADATLLKYESEVTVTGRLGRFALGMMKKKAQSLGDEFARHLQSKLSALEAAPADQDAATVEHAPVVADASVPVPAAGPSSPPSSVARTTAWPAAASVAPAAATPPSWWRRFLNWLSGASTLPGSPRS